MTMPAPAYIAGYNCGRGRFPGREHYDQHDFQPYTLLREAPRVLCEHDRSTTTPQVCLVDHEQNLWMTNCYGDCKHLMTLEGVMAAVHARHNGTGWEYVR